MASKKYAYYNKGNKIAIIEQYDSTSSGKLAVAHCTIGGGHSTKDACEAAGGQWIPGSSGSINNIGKYQSPQESVANGLEIEYTYIPNYRLNTKSTIQVNKFAINGWTITDGYLTFLRGHNNGVADWGSAPYNTVADEEYINIVGSSRWSGLHKVKSAQSGGLLQTYTKVDQEVAQVNAGTDTELQFSTAGKINGDDTEGHFLNAAFSAGEYIWIKSGGGSYNGLWLIDSVDDDSANESTSGIYIKNNYYTPHAKNTLLEEVEEVTTSWTASEDDANAVIYKAYRDFCYVQADITVMEDETFELDLTRYQTNAVVLYLKAKMFEDAGDIDKHEYYMRQFKKQLEKGASSRKYGPHIIQGHWSMRK